MTIKQVLIGTLLGSSIVGLMVHRMKKDQPQAKVIASAKLITHKSQVHKFSITKKKSKKHGGSMDTELSSSKLYGRN